MRNVRRKWPKLPKKKFNKLVKIIESNLGQAQCYGQTWNYDKFDKAPIIEIDPRQKPKEYLDTLTHELIHVADPVLTEDEVLYLSNFLSHYLWKHGYRRIQE